MDYNVQEGSGQSAKETLDNNLPPPFFFPLILSFLIKNYPWSFINWLTQSGH